MSKDLDRELAEVAGLDDNANGNMAVPQPSEDRLRGPAPARGGVEAPRRNVGLLVMLLVMVAGIVGLFLVGFQDAAIYSLPVEDVLARQAELSGRRLRIDGELVPGTLVKRDKPCEYRFRARRAPPEGEKAVAGGESLEIRYPQCVVPDAFRDVPEGGVLVTVEGTLLAEGHFEATNILAKCASKYDAETHEMKPEQPNQM